MECKEPYRATRLWNEVIKAFQCGMPLKKHRRNIHTYNDCFSASDAVTWLHCYLLNNPNFGPDVSRQQTINLLGKFMKCRVIECITVRSKKLQFCDNSHLYRFTNVSPQQFKTLPLRLVQSPSHNIEKETEKSSKVKKKYLTEFQKENIPECFFVEKKISLSELGLIWKTAIVSRLEYLLPAFDLSEIVDEKSVNGHVIKHNVCRISKTGVVLLIDKTDDIPPWVISAMKCLANWPNASGSGSCLPNYPGFEKDVFKVVRDFFINPQVPLLPAYLSSIMVSVFTHFLQDQIKNIYDDQNSIKNKRNSKYSPSSGIVKTSTPTLNSDRNKLLSKNETLPKSSDGKLLLDNPEVMWDYPSMVFFETDFGTSNPVTKVVPSHSDLYASCDYLHGSMESISTISVCSMNHVLDNSNNTGLISTSPLKNWSSDSCLKENKKNILTSQSLQLQRNMSTELCNRQSHSMFDLLFIDDSGSDEKLNTSVCSSKTLTEEEDRISLCNFVDKQKNVSVISNQNLCSATYSKSSPLSQCSNASENNSFRNNLNYFKDMTYPPELKLSFQLLLLFFNPPNRRQLHLLFRVINKILKNQKFILDVQMPMRDYLLKTFLPAIVQSDINQNILLGMVSFLLDNCEAIFQPPAGLKEEVEELSKSRNGRIVYSVDDTCFLTYCEMVSKQQYEEQKASMSNEALKSLLHSIVIDEKISEKERKRRVKQFKESHPDIYYELFPGKNHLVKSRSAFLNRFASLRM